MLIRVMKVKHNIKLKQLIAAIALPLAVGGLAAFLTKDGMKLFETMAKPPLAPPGFRRGDETKSGKNSCGKAE